MIALALLEVSSINLIRWISKEIKWKVDALMDKIFILAFQHILQKLSIFQTNLFVRGILSIRKV